VGKKPVKKSAPASPASATSEETAGSLESSPADKPAMSSLDSLADDIKNNYTLLVQLTSGISEDLQDKLGARVLEAENRISKTEDRELGTEQDCKYLKQHLATALERIEDLENRSRRNNLRILGFPEGAEDGNPVKFLQEILPELLDLEVGQTLEIERAHHTLAPRPTSEQRPRAFIMKFLRYPIRELLLRTARNKSQIKWKDHRISFFPDWSRDLQQKRQRFWEVRRSLREKNIKYGLFYPAILKVTYNGETLSFTDPGEVKKFLAQREGSAVNVTEP
uniref:L1 transposable element RRM domain-containing protein n=1 Tax=Latimeria chalumnae TaxID=7897 RepID=H3A9M4_LATCH